MHLSYGTVNWISMRRIGLNIRQKLVTAAAVCVLALGGAVGVGAPAHAASMLGGVSVVGACSNQLWIAPSATRAVLVANNTSGWRCQYVGATFTWTWYGYNIDLNRQCVVQYGAGAYAKYLNFYDPYSWRCWR
jgi:hypothetical protein